MVSRSIYIAAAALGGIIILGWFLASPPREEPYNSKEVNFPASDGVKISATWYVPKADQGRLRVVILTHEFDGDRHSWDPFISDFINRGFAVLAYDMRGFGKSQNVPKSGEYYDTLIRDIEGAVSWLKQQPNVDPERIGVVGAQLGGTVAYASSAYIKDVKAAVTISPATDVGSRLLGEGQEDFHPHSILFQFLDTERVRITPLIDRTSEPKEVRLYRPESPAVRASGISLLHRDLRAFSDLLRYLDTNL